MRIKTKIEQRRDRASAAILAMLVASEKPLTIDIIVRALNFQRQLIHDCLQRLNEQGVIARIGSGKSGRPFFFMMAQDFIQPNSSQTRDETKPVDSKPDQKHHDESDLIEVRI